MNWVLSVKYAMACIFQLNSSILPRWHASATLHTPQLRLDRVYRRHQHKHRIELLCRQAQHPELPLSIGANSLLAAATYGSTCQAILDLSTRTPPSRDCPPSSCLINPDRHLVASLHAFLQFERKLHQSQELSIVVRYRQLVNLSMACGRSLLSVLALPKL